MGTEFSVRQRFQDINSAWPGRWKKRPQAKGCGQPLEAQHSRCGFSPIVSRSNQTCEHLKEMFQPSDEMDFGLLTRTVR